MHARIYMHMHHTSTLVLEQITLHLCTTCFIKSLERWLQDSITWFNKVSWWEIRTWFLAFCETILYFSPFDSACSMDFWVSDAVWTNASPQWEHTNSKWVRLCMMCHRDRQNGSWVSGSRSGLVPCIAWRCSACDSPPPAWTWSLGHGAGPPSSPRTAGPSGSAGPAPGWTGSCSGPEVTPTLDWVMEHTSNSNGLIRVVSVTKRNRLSICCLGLTLILQWLTNSDTRPTSQGP